MYNYIPIYILSFVAILAIVSLPLAEYWSHIEMNKAQKLPYDWCDFRTFLIEFYKRYGVKDFEYDIRYNSIFLRTWDDKTKNYIHKIWLHASVIRFDDNKCMILYPWSYFKYCRWLKNYDKPKRNKELFTRK